MIDPQKIKKDCPKAYQMFSSFILGSLKGELGDLAGDVVDIVLTSRSRCLDFLDDKDINVIVQTQTAGGEINWFVTINEIIVQIGCETREEAEIAGIYKAFTILETL